MAEETNYKAAGEQPPSTVEHQAPEVSEANAPSTTETQATDIPSANTPNPEAANPDVNPNAAGAKAPRSSAPKGAAKPGAKAGADKSKGDEAAAAPKAKKEKPPALEDKPFSEFIQQDYLPALKTALGNQGTQDLELSFEKQKIPIRGFNQFPDCWQVMGRWNGGKRQFRVYFIKEDLQGQRGFSYAADSAQPSTLEPFLIDERKVTLDLLVFGVVQRLNAQKWLARN